MHLGDEATLPTVLPTCHEHDQDKRQAIPGRDSTPLMCSDCTSLSSLCNAFSVPQLSVTAVWLSPTNPDHPEFSHRCVLSISWIYKTTSHLLFGRPKWTHPPVKRRDQVNKWFSKKKLTHLLRTYNYSLLTSPSCSLKLFFTVMSKGLSSLSSHWLTWIQFIENCYQASHQNRHKSQGKWINGLSHCLL